MGSFLALDDLTAAAARRATVTSPDGLTLRSAPSQAADIVTVLPAGTAVTATGQGTTDGWALVQVNEQSGWVNVAYLSFDAPAAPVAAPAGAALTSAASSAGTMRMQVHYYHPSFEGSRMACGGTYH